MNDLPEIVLLAEPGFDLCADRDLHTLDALAIGSACQREQGESREHWLHVLKMESGPMLCGCIATIVTLDEYEAFHT